MVKSLRDKTEQTVNFNQNHLRAVNLKYKTIKGNSYGEFKKINLGE